MCRLKKKSEKNTFFFFSADIHLGDRVIKMAVICQRMAILFQLCADMIDRTLTFYLIPNLSNLEHMELCYKIINAKAKFWLRSNLEFTFLGFL